MRRTPHLVLPFALLCGTVGAWALGLEKPGESATPAPEPTAPGAGVAAPWDARHRLDWTGRYHDATGTMVVTLDADQRYTLAMAGKPLIQGRFSWFGDGRRILLDAAAAHRVLAVTPHHLHPLPDDRPERLGDMQMTEALVKN